MKKQTLVPIAASAVTAAVIAVAGVASAGNTPAAAEPAVLDDSSMHPTTTTVGGGADVLPTTRTVAHFWSSSVDPANGVTYGYNMVGANPYTCSLDPWTNSAGDV